MLEFLYFWAFFEGFFSVDKQVFGLFDQMFRWLIGVVLGKALNSLSL